MAKGESVMRTVSSNTSINFENYSQLLDALKETLKKLIDWLFQISG